MVSPTAQFMTTPVKFSNMYFCSECVGWATFRYTDILQISGTVVIFHIRQFKLCVLLVKPYLFGKISNFWAILG